jgi:hypothetical protein
VTTELLVIFSFVCNLLVRKASVIAEKSGEGAGPLLDGLPLSRVPLASGYAAWDGRGDGDIGTYRPGYVAV